MKEIIEILTRRKGYIGKLCDYYGEPAGVLEHLRHLASKYPFLLLILRKDIESYSIATKEYNTCLFDAQDLEDNQGGCFSCPWGNGEGGCTIPGYCPNN